MKNRYIKTYKLLKNINKNLKYSILLYINNCKIVLKIKIYKINK